MNKPNWITFTGVDCYTDLNRLSQISERYKGRVEWGVLFSANQVAKGNLRYPSEILVDAIGCLGSQIAFAAHLCGGYAKEANKGNLVPLKLHAFGRIQVNHRKPDIQKLNDFYDRAGVDIIAQSRDPEGFEMGGNVFFLFDQSGGRGEVPEKLPKAIGPGMVGYAGGINPENVLEVISRIDAERFWIDMETGVRNKHNLLDLDKCEAVLKAVYGNPT